MDIETLIRKYKNKYAVAEEIEEGGLISDVFKNIIADLELLSKKGE